MEQLHVGEAKAGFFRSLGIEEDACRDELADFEDNAVGGSDRRRQPGGVRFGSRNAARFCFSGYRHANSICLIIHVSYFIRYMEDERMTTTVKAYKGMGMEGSTARWYDRTTRKDLPEIRALAVRIAAAIAPAGQVLEVAPGPGFLSIELAKRGLAVRAVDISRTFVEIAQRNAAAEGVDVRFELGNAAALPLEDASVDFVVCRAAFKNFSEPLKALGEMRRVLRPGGKALLIDMRRDASMAEVKQYVNGLGVSRLNRWFMLFTFRFMLIKRAYLLEEFRRMAIEAGWDQLQIDTSRMGFEAWLTK